MLIRSQAANASYDNGIYRKSFCKWSNLLTFVYMRPPQPPNRSIVDQLLYIYIQDEWTNDQTNIHQIIYICYFSSLDRMPHLPDDLARHKNWLVSQPSRQIHINIRRKFKTWFCSANFYFWSFFFSYPIALKRYEWTEWICLAVLATM